MPTNDRVYQNRYPVERRRGILLSVVTHTSHQDLGMQMIFNSTRMEEIYKDKFYQNLLNIKKTIKKKEIHDFEILPPLANKNQIT